MFHIYFTRLTKGFTFLTCFNLCLTSYAPLLQDLAEEIAATRGSKGAETTLFPLGGKDFR